MFTVYTVIADLCHTYHWQYTFSYIHVLCIKYKIVLIMYLSGANYNVITRLLPVIIQYVIILQFCLNFKKKYWYIIVYGIHVFTFGRVCIYIYGRRIKIYTEKIFNIKKVFLGSFWKIWHQNCEAELLTDEMLHVKIIIFTCKPDSRYDMSGIIYKIMVVLCIANVPQGRISTMI